MATILCLALLFLGLLFQPWSLALVLAVCFVGPLLKRLDSFKESPISSWRRSHWIGFALGLSVVLLTLIGGNSGRGALILALLPVAWVLVTDRSLLQDNKQIERECTDESLSLSTTDAGAENNTSEMAIAWEAIDEWDLPEAILKSDDINPDLLSKFSVNDSREVRCAVALHPNCSTEILKKLENDQNQYVRSCTVYRDLPKEWITVDEQEIYSKVKYEDGLPDKIQEILAGSDDDLLKSYLAQRQDLTDAVVEKLSKESDPYILESLRERELPEEWKVDNKAELLLSKDASNEPIEERVLEILSASTDTEVRRCLAINQFTPDRLLERFRNDPEDEVSSTIKLRNLPVRLRIISPYELADAVINSDDLTPDQLDSLSYCWIDEVRAAVVAKDSTPATTLQRLSEDNSDFVKNAVRFTNYPSHYRTLSTKDLKSLILSNQAIPEGLLELYSEKDYSYREIIEKFGSLDDAKRSERYKLVIKKKYFSIHGSGIENLRAHIKAQTNKTNEEAISDCLDGDLGDQYFAHTIEDRLVAVEIKVSDLELKDENDCICFTSEYTFDAIQPVDPIEFLNMLRDDRGDIGTYSLQVKTEILTEFGVRNLRYYDPEVSISLESFPAKSPEDCDSGQKFQLKALYPWIVSRGEMEDDVCTNVKAYGLIAEYSEYNLFWLFSSESDELFYMREESVTSNSLKDGSSSGMIAKLLEKASQELSISLGIDTSKTSRLVAHNLKLEDYSSEFTISDESDSAYFQEVIQASSFDDDIEDVTACYSWKYSFELSDQESLSRLNLDQDSDLLNHFGKKLNLSLLESLGIQPSIDYNKISFYDSLQTSEGIVMPSNNAVSDESSEDENVEQQEIDLPAEWQDLEVEQLVSKLRDSELVDIDILRVLASSDDWLVRQAVAWHDSTPDDVLKILSNDDDSDVINATRERDLPKSWRFMSRDERIEALKADDVPSEIIELFAGSEDWIMRQAVAWSPSTQDPILEKLKDDEDEDVQVAVTTDRRLPVDWRFMSGWDQAERLREESTELAILETLVQSRDSDVRRAVALHPSTPESLLNTLREDNVESVQSGIRERDLPDSWKMRDEDEIVLVLKTDEVPESVVAILSKSHSWRIRQAVALSSTTPQAILDELLNDRVQYVQSAVRERALPDEWKILDDDEKVERLNGQEAPAQVLDILSRSGQWLVRQAVANKPETSEEILKNIIENDDDDDVIKAAKKTLRKIAGNSGDKQNSGPLTYCFGVYEGDSTYGSCYLADLETTEQGDHDVDDGEITDELREELQESRIGWGPFKDQKLIITTEEDGDEDIIAVVDIEEAIDSGKVHDCHVCLGYGTKGKHIIGIHTEKGGFNGKAELDIEYFDEDKITFGLVNLADNWFIINSIQYDGEEIGMEGDTTGKGSEYYKFEDDETEYIC